MDKSDVIDFLNRHDINADQFAAMMGRNRSCVYDFGGRNPVPYYARLIMKLVDERGGVHGLVPGR